VTRPAGSTGGPLRERLAYGAPAFALALFGVPVYVHLPKFYADIVGVPLGALGAAILITRSWDAVLDPVVGVLSDRTRTRWGRRRPYLLFAPVPLALAVLALFAPPHGSSVWWFATTMALAFLAWTLVQIPHAALGPEITTEHHARTALFAVRDGLWIAGTLAAAAGPALVRGFFGFASDAEGTRSTFIVLGGIYAGLLVVLPWTCALLVRERYVQPVGVAVAARAPRDTVIEALRNRPFRLLLAAYAVGALGGALPGTLLFFYVEHVLQAPERADLFLGLYFLAAFLCLPVWTGLARRFGKKEAFVAATGMAVAVFTGAFFLGPGDTGWFTAIVVLSGAGFGASLALPASMQADTIDLDELQSGTRREGLFLGLWSVVSKASAAVGAGVALPILGAAGYVAGAPQAPGVALALRILYCLVPCVCYGLALVIVSRYPLDEPTHRAIRETLERRSASKARPAAVS
jgi:GPH family glycoside/pentoside/hexuronide:cation symporter